LGAACLSGSAFAYPTYQRLGYVSCTACHFLPTGGGLLTPYGLGVQATLSAWSRDINPPEQAVNQGVQARVIGLNSTNSANPFLMQADYLNSSFVNKYVRVDAAVGAALQQGQDFLSVPGGWNDVLVRRFLITGLVDDEQTIQVGRDYYPQGLNIDDHTSFLKMDNTRNVTDYPTQVRYIHQSETLQLMPYLYAPSFEETPENQEQGAGMRAEYALDNSDSVGALAQFGDNMILSRTEGDVFFRLSEAHWNGVIGEGVYTFKRVHSTGEAVNQWDTYVEPYVGFPEWIETGWVYEYLHETDPMLVAFDYGPRINIRLMQWLSVLGDGRNISTNGTSAWSFYGQAFLHIQI